MIPFKADLHCHSCYSDGTDTPHALIDLALSQGLSGLSITDHDTIEAYAEAIDYASAKGLRLLKGVEFSAYYLNDPVHVLGYNYDLKNSLISDFCAAHITRRRARNEAILEKLRHLGFEIDYKELSILSKGPTIGRPHIATLLVNKGIVSSVKEAFDRFLGEGKSAFDPGEPVGVEETIAVIQQAGGKAILAHPHLLKKESCISFLLQLPFDGIEAYYASLPHRSQERWLKVAQERHWLISGGSDYHGTVKPQNQLGSSWVDELAFEALLK